jgi:FkbM family methyltransferase
MSTTPPTSLRHAVIDPNPPSALRVQLTRWKRGLYKKYVNLTKPRFMIERRQGVLLLLDRKSVVDRYLVVHGEWEAKQVAKLRELTAQYRPAGKRSAFLDIGAHGGYYSLLMDKHERFDEIVLFEPDPVNSAQLTANLFLNAATGRLRLIQAAAAAAPGTMRFDAGPEENRGLAKELTADETVVRPVLTLPAVRVDDMVTLRDGFLVAKIDVEGGELNALAGMTQLLAANDAVLQIERFYGPVEPLTAWLVDHGFRHVGQIEYDHYFVKSTSTTS